MIRKFNLFESVDNMFIKVNYDNCTEEVKDLLDRIYIIISMIVGDKYDLYLSQYMWNDEISSEDGFEDTYIELAIVYKSGLLGYDPDNVEVKNLINLMEEEVKDAHKEAHKNFSYFKKLEIKSQPDEVEIISDCYTWTYLIDYLENTERFGL